MAVKQSLTVTLLSQSVEKNQSQVRILWQSTQTGTSYNMTERTGYYYYSINGGTETEKAVTYTLPYQSTQTVADVTVTVAHDSEGKASIAVRSWMDTHISAGVVELEKTLTLTTIPRASTVSASDGLIEGTSTVSVVRKSSSFTHTVAYKFGSLSGYLTAKGGISSSAVKLTAVSIPFSLPESFYAQIPNSKTGTCTLTCKTYQGSTQIGSAQTCTFRVSVDSRLCKPDLSGSTVADVNGDTLALTGDSSVLVRYASQAKCTIAAQTVCSAGSIAQKKMNGTAVSGSTLTVDGPQSGSFTFYAEDSRGISATKTVTCPLISYIPLTNNASVKRTNPTDGNARISFSGNYFTGSFGVADNELFLSYRIGSGEEVPVAAAVDNGKYTATAELAGMDYEKSFSITVTARDKLQTVQKTLTLEKGIPVFDWGKNDFAFHVPVTVDGVLTAKGGIKDETSQWHNLVLDDAFEAYKGDSKYHPKYIASGNVVTVMGCVSPKEAFTSSGSQVGFCTGLPEKYWPAFGIDFMCQGPGINRWSLRVGNKGLISMARYGTHEYKEVPTGAMLNFCVTYQV